MASPKSQGLCGQYLFCSRFLGSLLFAVVVKDNFSSLFPNPLRDKRAMIKRGVNITYGTPNDRKNSSLLTFTLPFPKFTGPAAGEIQLDPYYGGCHQRPFMTEMFTFWYIFIFPKKMINEMIIISVKGILTTCLNHILSVELD